MGEREKMINHEGHMLLRCSALFVCISEYLALLKGHLCPNAVELVHGESV